VGTADDPVFAAYVDDVKFFLRSAKEIQIVQEALRIYTEASGAEINYVKSRTMALGGWQEDIPVMGMSSHAELRILGILFKPTICSTATASWKFVTDSIRQQARDVYHRDLSLIQKVQYANAYLLAKTWHLAQVLPPPPVFVRQINMVLSWFCWKGSIFKVLLSTLRRPKLRGGLHLLHVEAKCRALLLFRLQEMNKKPTLPTVQWLHYWGLQSRSSNPSNRNSRMYKFQYLCMYALDLAYVMPQHGDETLRHCKRRLYTTLILLLQDTPGGTVMRIEQKWRHTSWIRVWTNLWSTPVDDRLIGTWYTIIHDIVPTGDRLHVIHLTTDYLCLTCQVQDTLLHRLTECGEGARHWLWIKTRLAVMLRMYPHYIPADWLV
jgi:hypothetical protein